MCKKLYVKEFFLQSLLRGAHAWRMGEPHWSAFQNGCSSLDGLSKARIWRSFRYTIERTSPFMQGSGAPISSLNRAPISSLNRGDNFPNYWQFLSDRIFNSFEFVQLVQASGIPHIAPTREWKKGRWRSLFFRESQRECQEASWTALTIDNWQLTIPTEAP